MVRKIQNKKHLEKELRPPEVPGKELGKDRRW